MLFAGKSGEIWGNLGKHLMGGSVGYITVGIYFAKL